MINRQKVLESIEKLSASGTNPLPADIALDMQADLNSLVEALESMVQQGALHRISGRYEFSGLTRLSYKAPETSPANFEDDLVELPGNTKQIENSPEINGNTPIHSSIRNP